MSLKSILVPTDFTKEAHTAINHAVELADTINGEVILLHVVESKDDVEPAKAKLAKEQKLAHEMEGSVPVKTMIRIGNIFDDIGDAAAEINASMIIMGTHGASGWQKVAGSHALKVVTNSSVPFVIVQNDLMHVGGYDKIMIPLDLHNETKQKLEIVADMAKYFDSEVHIFTPKETDEFLSNKLNGNIAWAKKYLAGKGIKSATHVSEKGNFVKNMIAAAKDLEIDLISIMNLQKNSLMGMFGSSYEQSIITNEAQIPVLCVNPKIVSSAGGSVFSR
jgi:nucleotide-binding universal stress UspA family protein